MNILLISRFINSTTGGVPYVNSLIAKFLAETGNNLYVISNKIQEIEYTPQKNMKIIYLQTYTTKDVPKWKTKDKLHYIFSGVIKGYSIIKNEKIDLIISHTNQPSIVGWILSSLTSLPHIVTIHGTDSLNPEYLKEWAKQKGNSKWKSKIGYQITKAVFKLNYTAIHAVSETVKDDLIRIGVTKPIFVIHNGIPLEPPLNREIKQNQFIIISRLEFFKNIQVVINAIKILKESYPNLKLIILGDGSYRSNLEKLTDELDLKNNVLFKGYISGIEKKIFLSESQALVFPSLSEGFGMVILEAYMQKKPVLISNIRPLTDIVENEKTGLIVAQNNEKFWADTIEKIIKEPQKTSNMGHYCREFLEQNYSLELISEKFLKMCKEVIMK